MATLSLELMADSLFAASHAVLGHRGLQLCVAALCLPEVYLLIRRIWNVDFRPSMYVVCAAISSEIGIVVIASYGISGSNVEAVFNVMSLLATVLHNTCEVLVDLKFLEPVLEWISCRSGWRQGSSQRFDL